MGHSRARDNLKARRKRVKREHDRLELKDRLFLHSHVFRELMAIRSEQARTSSSGK